MALLELILEVVAETMLASPRIVLAASIGTAGGFWLSQTGGGAVAGAVIGLIVGIGWEVAAAWNDEKPEK